MGNTGWRQIVVGYPAHGTARRHMARNEYAEARHILDEAIARTPRETILWEVLGHTVLQEGKDIARAERAIGTVLELSRITPNSGAPWRFC